MIRTLDGASPSLHETAFVSELAYVIGDVDLGEGSSVWPGAVVRADLGRIAIGSYTCIQDNSVVHGDADVKIGDNVVIAHRVVCHASSIGDRVLIGNGAVVSNGAVIGEDSLVAPGTVIMDDQEIPPGSIVAGVPGRVRGRTRARHREMIQRYGAVYVQLTRRYRAQGGLS